VTGKKDPKKNLKPFKPGVSGNPGGRPKLPDDIKEARKLGQIELERVINKYIYLSRDELKAALADTATPMFEIMVASIIAQAAQKGDQVRLDFILNRVVGKVTDRIEHSTPKPFVIERSDGSQLVLGAKVEKEDE
jgi:hypothetical protein